MMLPNQTAVVGTIAITPQPAAGPPTAGDERTLAGLLHCLARQPRLSEARPGRGMPASWEQPPAESAMTDCDPVVRADLRQLLADLRSEFERLCPRRAHASHPRR